MKQISIKTKDREVFMIRESLLESIIKDGVSLGLLMLLLYVNYNYGGNSETINLFGMILFFGYIVGLPNRKNKIKDIDEAIAYLQSIKKRLK